MEYIITAPVVLRINSSGTEEEPLRFRITADTKEEAVQLFQKKAKEVLVETKNCKSIDFYPYERYKSLYEFRQE